MQKYSGSFFVCFSNIPKSLPNLWYSNYSPLEHLLSHKPCWVFSLFYFLTVLTGFMCNLSSTQIAFMKSCIFPWYWLWVNLYYIIVNFIILFTAINGILKEEINLQHPMMKERPTNKTFIIIGKDRIFSVEEGRIFE